MRRALRHTVLALAAACALGASTPACADPVTIITVAAYAAGSAGVMGMTMAIASYVALGASIIGGLYARKKAKRAAADARNAQAAAMTDRCITLMTAEPEPNVVYGRCAVGGWVIDKITTAKTYVDDQGRVRTKPDAYQHVVIGIAGHECQAVHDVFMYGEWVGAIGADGWVSGGPADAPYGKVHAIQLSQTVTFANGAATLAAAQQGYSITRLISISQDQAGDSGAVSSAGTLAGLAISGGPASGTWNVTVEITKTTSSLRIEFGLGTSTQLASAYLRSVAPAVWTDAHRLLGITYAVITFDLDDSRHQGVPSDLAFEVSGRKVLDPRTGTTAWSRNAALCVYDWMRAPWGYRLGTDDINVTSVINAATTADQPLNLVVGGVATSGPRYTLDGAFGVNADKAATLGDMLETMGGFASQSAQWAIHAGAWTAPVMAITDDDLAAPVRVVRSHTPIDERFNAAKASYLPERKVQPSEVDPYINAVFAAADGGREWGSFTLPFTNNKARGRNLLRQFVEQSRAGMILQYTGKARLWPLEVGDRVTVTSGRFGLVADTFRVLDWSWSPGQPVALTLQRDIAASYDDADASTADPAPATRLPNPGVVDTPSGLVAASGTAQLLKMADGTIIPRVLLSWTAPKTIYMSDPSARTLVSWRRAAEATWTEFPLAGNTTETYIDGVRDRDVIIIRVQHLNSFGVGSAWVAIAHSVIGKTAPPTSPTALAVMETAAAVRRYTVTHAQDVDHGGYIVRFSSTLTATFDQMTQVCARWDGDSLISEASSPLDGAYRFGVAAFDTTGNLSSAAAYVTATLSGLAAIGGAANAATVAAAAAAAAADARAVADNALTKANAANTALASIASDSVLSPSEKPEVVQDYNVLIAEQSGIDAQAGNYGITTERTAYNASVTALTSYLGALGGWNTIPGVDVPIVGVDFRGKFTAVYAARQTLLNKISAQAKILADAAQAAAVASQNAANTAQAAASAAQASANNALGQLQAIASDGVLSRGEKSQVILDWTELWNSRQGIIDSAAAYGIASTAFTSALTVLANHLTALSPGWSDTSADTTIIPATWRTLWDAAYQSRTTLLNAIAAQAKYLADTAQGSANGAQAAAAAAQGAANMAQAAASAAQASANNALGQLQAIASDGVLSRGEKSQVILDWTELWNGQPGIVATANALGIVDERDAYTAAVNVLAQYLTALSPGWADTSLDTTIIPAIWRSNWDAAYQKRQVLLNRIAVVSSQRADWLSVGNRPANVAALVGGEDINNAKLGQASNLINCQTGFANNSTVGWVMGSWVTGMPLAFQGSELTRWPPGDWVPVGGNAICLYQGVPATTANTFNWGGAYPGGNETFAVAYTEALIPVVPGNRYCASAYLASHRCTADLYIEFKTVSGAGTGGGYSNSPGVAQGGRSLSGWQRTSVFAVAPADAVCARLLFAKRNTLAGNTDSCAWMTQPMIELAGASQTVPSAYSPSAATSHAQLGLIGTFDLGPESATEVIFTETPAPPIFQNIFVNAVSIAELPYIVKRAGSKAKITCSFNYELIAPSWFDRSIRIPGFVGLRYFGITPIPIILEVGVHYLEFSHPAIIDFPTGASVIGAAILSLDSGDMVFKVTSKILLVMEIIKA